MSAFATGDDLRARWSLAPEGNEADAVLEDASVWLQAVYDLPDNPSEKLLSVLRMIVCSMTKRVLLSENHDHVSSLAQTAGPFTHSSTFRNSEGNLFLTKAEREMLEKMLDSELNRSRGMTTVEALGW